MKDADDDAGVEAAADDEDEETEHDVFIGQ